MAKYKPGDTVYFIESNRSIIEAKVKAFTAGFYTTIFGNSVIRLRESRLFPSIEEAENNAPQIVAERKRVEKLRKEQSNPWNYMN